MAVLLAQPQARRWRVRGVSRRAVFRHFVWSRLAYRIARRVRAKGYPVLAAVPSDALGQHIFLDGLYEEDLLLALFDAVLARRRAQFEAAVALDVGANVGNHALFFARRFRQVVAFEPNPPVAKLLEANVALNDADNVRVVPVGLADESRDLLFIQDESGNLGGSGFADGAGPARAGRTRVLPVRRGDEELERLALAGRVALIKIDVEGYELQVLKGLARTIARESPLILFESNRASGPGGGQQVIEWLRQQQYEYVYSVGRRWRVPAPIAQVPKLRGAVELLLGWLWGGDYWCEPVERLQERPYRLLLAAREPLEPETGLGGAAASRAW